MSVDHCWHGTTFFHNVPSQVEETCCWCSATRTKTVRIVNDRPHGPHVVGARWREDVTYQGGDGPCGREKT